MGTCGYLWVPVIFSYLEVHVKSDLASNMSMIVWSSSEVIIGVCWILNMVLETLSRMVWSLLCQRLWYKNTTSCLSAPERVAKRRVFIRVEESGLIVVQTSS